QHDVLARPQVGDAYVRAFHRDADVGGGNRALIEVEDVGSRVECDRLPAAQGAEGVGCHVATSKGSRRVSTRPLRSVDRSLDCWPDAVCLARHHRATSACKASPCGDSFPGMHVALTRSNYEKKERAHTQCV